MNQKINSIKEKISGVLQRKKDGIKSLIKFLDNLFTQRRDKEMLKIIRQNIKELEDELT